MKIYRPEKKGVRFRDHTADMWIESKGNDICSMISRMIQGIYGVMADSFDLNEETDERTIESEDEDIETAMVDHLNEFLFLFDAEAGIILDPRTDLEKTDGGYRFITKGRLAYASVSEGEGGAEIKAITYHEASIEKEDGATIGRVLVDI